MIPNPDYRPPFPQNRTFFVILMIHDTGDSEVFHILFHTEGKAVEAAQELKEQLGIKTFRIYPVTSPRQQYAGGNFWY